MKPTLEQRITMLKWRYINLLKEHKFMSVDKRRQLVELLAQIKLIVGNIYHIDKGFTNGGEVKLISIGNHFCTVQDPETGEQWRTMCHRLSKTK